MLEEYLKININMENLSIYTIISFIFLIIGVFAWISWGLTFGVWADIGIYSFTIVFVLSGILGIIISLMDPKEEKN